MQFPIVLIIFNRSNTTEQVFNAIRQAKPSKLFVIADGPRNDRPDDIEKCAAARAIIEQVDWDCEVIKKYSAINLGCRANISSGLNWVFEQTETAIILEDDCLPHPTFFPFCEALLERYKDDERISSISAQRLYNVHATQFSYSFSLYPHCWGWATWKRAWQQYDADLATWPTIKKESLLKSILSDSNGVGSWEDIFEAVYNQQINSWAYPWTFSCWLQHSLSIHPCANLVSNIGFGADATHTTNMNSPFESLPITAMQFPLRHPPYVIRDFKADAYIQKNVFDASRMQRLRNYFKEGYHRIFTKITRCAPDS